MTRLLLAALAAVAALAALLWASARDLRQPWTAIPTPDPDDDMAGVQVDVRPLTVTTPDWLAPPWRITNVPQYGTGDYWPQPWPTYNGGGKVHIQGGSWDPNTDGLDHPYLVNHPIGGM